MGLQRADYFNNTEGLNLTDSPFFVKDGQATGGYNYDYVKTGGIQKIRGITKVNSSADAQLKTLGLGLHNTASGTKTVIRAAGTKIQTLVVDSGLLTNQSEDTSVSNTDFLSASSTQPIVSNNFVTAAATVLWLTGGGLTLPYGYTGTNITKNGANPPTGTLGATLGSGGTGGVWAATGTRYWAVALRKRGTQSISNADLDVSVNIDVVTKKVTLDFTTITIDTTKYDKILVYRSSVSGVEDFTAGDLVATLDSTTTTYDDIGNAEADTQVVPRAGNTSLDNSVLEAGTYNSSTVFKRRFVVASNSTVSFSDLDKHESWPTGLKITIPTGGPITGLCVIGYNAPTSGVTDEYLVVFKERETWVITGTLVFDSDTSLYDVELKFVDNVGCATQALAVRANGFVAWVDYRGVYMWSGQGKPIYTSRPIEGLFGPDGDLDKTRLSYGWGVFYREKNQIVWSLSHRVKGENKVRLKLDLRLTVPRMSESLEANTICEGVFTMDTDTTPWYAGLAYLPSDNREIFLVGDNAGYTYKSYYGVSNNSSGIDFSYLTKAFDQERPTVAKQYSKVVVYIDESVAKDLTLEYWAGYRTSTAERSQIAVTMEAEGDFQASLWDLAYWDEALWDEYMIRIIPVVFNLSSQEGNNQGDSIMLQFSQSEASAPVTIHGFSIYWDEIALRK